MFVDKVNVHVKAGDGGDGSVSFRKEKFVDRGGPDGGDGGNGGDVVFEASRNQNTLSAFRYQKKLEAESGESGSKRRQHGKNGQNLYIAVPVGTVVLDKEEGVIADLDQDGQKVIIASGGKGGFGNAHFVSSVRQAPKVAEKGESGDEMELTLELKMIADIGLVGLPNAGKSTLLSVISNARPEIADYPFTTIRPNLGVVDIDRETSLLFADIPGLIEGASQGKGLGDEFLRHVERTRALVHLIDIYENDPAKAYETIQQELKEYRVDLSKLPQIVVLSKIDGLDQDIVDDKLAELKKSLKRGAKPLAISAVSGQNVAELLTAVKQLIIKHEKKHSAKAAASGKSLPVIRLKEDENQWSITKTKKGYVVTGRKIEKFAERTDFSNHHAEARLRDIMKKMGILRELNRRGIEADQTIFIGKNSLKY